MKDKFYRMVDFMVNNYRKEGYKNILIAGRRNSGEIEIACNGIKEEIFETLSEMLYKIGKNYGDVCSFTTRLSVAVLQHEVKEND